MYDPHASQITITDTAILLRGAESPAPIVDRRIDGRLLVATSGTKRAWLVLDQAEVPDLLAKRIKLPVRVVEERIITPIEDLASTVALVEAWVVGGGREADEAAVAKKAAAAAKRAATAKAKADAAAAVTRAEAAERAAAEAVARREAADAARPALVAACRALAAESRIVSYHASPYADGELTVRTPYDPRIVEALRGIPGARWNESIRVWAVPARSHAALGKRLADIATWSAQTSAANAEAARIAEEARSIQRAALAARRFLRLADRVPAVGTMLRRDGRLIVVESHGKVFRTSDDDGLLDPWMEGEMCCYVYHRDATADEIAALQPREPEPNAAPVMVAQQAQQQQACAATPAAGQVSRILEKIDIERQVEIQRAKVERAVIKCEIIGEIRSEMVTAYWDTRAERDVCNSRASKREVHFRHVLDEMISRHDAACTEMEAAYEALWALQAKPGNAIPTATVLTQQQAQQQQARDMRPPEPREIRVTALGHQGHPCDPESTEASLWIVTDGRLSRDCASHRQALDLAEDFRVWGYVVPAN